MVLAYPGYGLDEHAEHVHTDGALEPTNTCEFRVGRLMEIRVAAGYRSVSDIDHMIGLIVGLSNRLPDEGKYVIAADWRKVSVMSPSTAARARAMLTMTNPRVIRSAILTEPSQSTANLQVVRLVQESENKHRRQFSSPLQMRAWLSEVLTGEESARLQAFLEESDEPMQRRDVSSS